MNRVLLPTAIAMALTAHVGFAQLCPPDDALEPNNTLLDASPLTGPTTLGPLVILFDDPDHFRLTVQPGMEAIFDLAYSSSLGPLALRLTLSDGTLLDFDNAFGSSQQVSATNFSMSPIDLIVSVADFFILGESCNDYSLVVSTQAFQDPCSSIGDDGFEDNDDCSTAVALGAGSVNGLIVSSLDPDYYRISVPPGSDALVRADYFAPGGWLRVHSKISPCGGFLGSSGGNSGVAELSLTNPGPTTVDYEVFVTMNTGSPTNCNGYNLTTSFSPSLCLSAEDPFEENDTCETRVSLPLGETTGMLLSEDDLDWFEINVPAGGTLDISLTGGFPSAFQSLQVWERCDINTSLASAFGPTPLQVVATNTGPVAETWIVRVWSIGYGTNGHTQCNVVDMNATLTNGSAGLVENLCGAGAGLSGCSACPCGNVPASLLPLRGCANSTNDGATLLATGAAFLSSDELRFETRNTTPISFGILVSGDNSLPLLGPCPPGSGITSPVADGLRCVGGNLIRHGARASDAAGDTGLRTPAWGGNDAPLSGLIAQGGFSAGQTRGFQVFYRDTVSAACGTGQNTTNAVRVTFAP